MHQASEKPFDWKKSGTYSWKAAFPLGHMERVTRDLHAAAAQPPHGKLSAKPGPGTTQA